MAYKTRRLIFLGCSLYFFSSSAHAYLDPGSVSLVLQSVVAAIAGAALFWKHWFYRLRDLLGMGKKERKDTGEKNADWEESQKTAEDE